MSIVKLTGNENGQKSFSPFSKIDHYTAFASRGVLCTSTAFLFTYLLADEDGSFKYGRHVYGGFIGVLSDS